MALSPCSLAELKPGWLHGGGAMVRVQTRVVWVSMGAESEIYGCYGFGREGGGGIVEGAVSGSAGEAEFLQRVAAGSGAAHVNEQFGSGGGREAGGLDCLWGHG